MVAFGRWGGFPRRFGGGQSYAQQEYTALRSALAPDGRGYDIDDPLLDVEIGAHAIALGMIWAINARTKNQAIPARMLEEVTRWEEILKLRPDPADSDNERRAAIEAKLRGLTGNTIVDVEATARSIFGPNFVSVYTVDPDDDVTYWPGVNPGPPGFEWSTNRMTIGVAVSRVGLSDEQMDRKMPRLYEVLDLMLPVWMTFCVGTEDADDDGGFICDIGTCDLTLL
jgi:hypothetical protein